ncbi:MAG: FHA domain-containing protein [Cyanobacteria bacterium P01_A01_bin.123]
MTYTSPCHQVSIDSAFYGLRNIQPLVQQDSMLLDQIFESCDYDLDQINQVIDPVLSAQQRCQLTTLYVHGVVIEQRVFLSTNLNQSQEIMVLPSAANWLMGSSPHCPIAIDHREVDRCHAVLGYLTDIGFYIADVGSQTGTRVNRCLLAPLQRRSLRNGDLIELGQLCIEFFIDRVGQPAVIDEDETHY